MSFVAAACGGGGQSAPTSPPTTVPTTNATKATTTTVTTKPTTTTAPLAPVTGPETVLSPIGLHVRAGPSLASRVLGTAAQGTVFQLLGRTPAHGGWLKVRGATVTGWVSANPALSQPGRFISYSSGPFDVLYPAGWVATGTPATGVTFRPAAEAPGGERVLMRVAPSLAKLGISVAGGVVSSARQVVACGFTSYLYSYATSAPGQHVYTLALRLAPGHYVGLKATTTSPAQLRSVMDFVNSAVFPFPQCVGGLPTQAKPPKPAKPRTATT